MTSSTVRGLRKHLTLVVSGTLVLLMGGLGLVAGHTAGRQAVAVHREDRLGLQLRLAGLVDQYAQLMGAEVHDRLRATPDWSPTPGDPGTVLRLRDVVEVTRALDVGAVLLGPAGQPLGSWSASGALPAQDDPGWEPLRDRVRERDGGLPLSGLLRHGTGHAMALGVPAALSDGTTGVLVGLWDPRKAALQQYVSTLRYGATGHGYVLDSRGLALAAPDPDDIGAPLPLPELREQLRRGGTSGVLDTDDGDGLVTSYAVAESSGWTALTPQDRDEFEGVLVSSSRRVEAAVVALLVIAGAGLVVLHAKRVSALSDVALHDDLTGTYNRRGWFALAEHELERARRQGTERVLLFVDVDGLKQVNDALGHREGDRAIVDAASVLTSASRSSDLVGRLGGDEFVLLLGEQGRLDVARRRVLDALEAHNAKSGAGFELRLSVGAEVWFPTSADSLAELVRRADAQMYADKSSRPTRAEGVLRLPEQRASREQLPTA